MTEKRLLSILTMAAFLYRALAFLIFRNELVISSDVMNYITLGRNLASGSFYGVLDTYWAPFFPFLIGMATKIVGGLVLPSVILSLLAGTLAVPATFLFVREFFGKPAATIAAVLAIFFPHLINSTFALGTENVYLLLITAALIFGWRALNENKSLHHTLTGAFLGLAYLTRPEAFAYPAYFVLIALVVDIWNRKQMISRRLPKTLLMLFAFAIFAVPYLTYLRAQTGNWSISGKTQINSVMSEFASPDEESTSDAKSTGSTPGVSFTIKIFITYVADNLIAFNKILPFFMPTFLAMLIGIGLFGTNWNENRLKSESYLLGFCVITVIGYVATVVQLRYLYILLPVVLGWLALGIMRIQEWAERSLVRFGNLHSSLVKNKLLIYLTCAFCIYIYLFPINFWARSSNEAWNERAYEEREAGLWLKANGKPSAQIFSAGSRVPFYSEGIQVSPHSTDPNKVYGDLLETRLDYIVVGDRSEKRNPFMREVRSWLSNSSDFRVVFEDKRNPKYSLVVYEKSGPR
jgi:4-amino-4-deoxy-L-arabinose transferase-like glycosyltransferase